MKNAAKISELEQNTYTEDQIAFAEGVKNILTNSNKINVKTIQNMAKTAGLKIKITGNEKVDRENMRRLVAETLERLEKLGKKS